MAHVCVCLCLCVCMWLFHSSLKSFAPDFMNTLDIYDKCRHLSKNISFERWIEFRVVFLFYGVKIVGMWLWEKHKIMPDFPFYCPCTCWRVYPTKFILYLKMIGNISLRRKPKCLLILKELFPQITNTDFLVYNRWFSFPGFPFKSLETCLWDFCH